MQQYRVSTAGHAPANASLRLDVIKAETRMAIPSSHRVKAHSHA